MIVTVNFVDRSIKRIIKKKISISDKEYRKNHKEESAAYHKIYEKDNAYQISARKKQYGIINKEKILAQKNYLKNKLKNYEKEKMFKSKAKFTAEGTRICSRCDRVESPTVLFRKRRNQCIDCINSVRSVGYKRKIRIEQSLLEENGIQVRAKYKKEWYEDNRDMLSDRSKANYLNNRENRLLKANDNYYNEDKIINTLLRLARSRAKYKKLSFDLDKNYLEKMYLSQNKKCALTKINFAFEKVETSKRPFAPSVDRIDSKLGYLKGNIRLVCIVVNISLNEFGDTVFDKMCRAYIENTLLGK